MAFSPLKTSTALLLVLFSLSACGSPEQKEARYIKKGEALLQEKNYDKARIEFLNAAKLKPTDPNAIYHLGLVDDAQGNFRDAFANFSNAEQQDKHFHPAELMLAEYYLAGDQYAAANERIDSVLAETPDDAQGHALWGARFLRQREYNDALTQAQKSLASDPNNVLAYGVLNGAYKALNENDKAAEVVEEGIKHNPKNETLLRLRIENLEDQGDLNKIAQAYQDLFAVAPQEYKYRLQLANDYIKAGQIDQAEATFRAGVTALPDNWAMKHEIVEFLTAHRDIASAIQELRQYIKDNPDNSEPVDWLIDLYLTHNMQADANNFLDQIIDQANYDQLWSHVMTAKAKIEYLQHHPDNANKLIAQVLEKTPNNFDAQFLKARIEAEKGDDNQATIDLRGIIRDKPRAKEAYDLLSEVLLKEGHTDLAIDTLNQLSEIMLLSPEEQVRLAQLYALNGNSKHARELLLATTKSDPTYPIGWEMTARIALDAKDFPSAETAIQTLDNLPEQHLTAQLLSGEELALTGKSDEALAVYKNIIKSDPSSPQAQHAVDALIQTYSSKDQLDQAASYLETIKTDMPQISTVLGKIYLILGNDDKAAANFNEAIANHPKDQDPYINLAQILAGQQKKDAAKDLLKEAEKVNPSDMRAFLIEAQTDEKTGDYASALSIYSDLLAKYPDNNLIANNFAEDVADHDYKDSSLLEKARQVAERFTDAQNPLLLDTLGWVYYRQGRTDDALSVFARATAIETSLPPQFHYHYGAALLKAGRKEEAKQELQKATSQGAVYPGSSDASSLLTSLNK